MSYLVLARKYRPQGFEDVIGQEHITEILKRAIQSGRISQAYLFCGPRGIGKTTCARIMAMCLNCENGPMITPPGDSQICCEIAKGTNLDVLEIDGASNRGIDEIRTLRENIKFAPSYGRYKIYIVDEVHMLTMEAFNALLKTLEEPPEHVKFIFATTEPHKVPATIISRCQRFDFKRIALQAIVETLLKVSRQEKLEVEEEALYAVAKSAQGSLRDALSVLDQMSALNDRKIMAGDVYSMLGVVEVQLMFDLVDAVAKKDCMKALEILDNIINQGKDVKQLNKDMIEHFRNLMVVKIGGRALGKLIDYPLATKEMFLTQAERFTINEILTAIDTLISVQDVARITETVRMPLEVAMAKLTYRGQQTDASSAPLRPQPRPKDPDVPSKTTSPVNSVSIPPTAKGQGPSASLVKEDSANKFYGDNQPLLKAEERAVEALQEPDDSLNVNKITRMWDTITHAVSKERMSTATYLQEGSPVSLHNQTLKVGFPETSKFHKETLESKENVALLEKILKEKFGVVIRVKYEITDDFQAKEEDPSIQSVLDAFSGKVVNRWHNEGGE